METLSNNVGNYVFVLVENASDLSDMDNNPNLASKEQTYRERCNMLHTLIGTKITHFSDL